MVMGEQGNAVGVSDNASTTVAEAIAHRLAETGVKRVFGVPGGGSISVLIAALSRAGVEFKLAHTETGAAFMASVEAELSGRPGVVMATLGPGAASLVNGLAHCKLDRVPVLAITDRLGQAFDLPGYHQRLDHSRILDEVVKGSMTLAPSRVTSTVHRALSLAATYPPGPVHLDLPVDVVGEPTTENETSTVASPAPLCEPSSEGLKRAKALLSGAERPVIVAGLGLRVAGIGTLAKVAGALRAPVLTTYKGKGAIDERDPWSAGLITGGTAEKALLEQTDLLLTVGLDAVELIVGNQINASRVDLSAIEGSGPLPQPLVQVVGDLAVALAALEVHGNSMWTSEEIEAYREEIDAALANSAPSAGTAMHPWEVALTVAEYLDGEAMVTVDAGAHMLPVAQAWRARKLKEFWISNGLSTMGYALPAAVALSINQPDRPVVCLTGDGGLLMAAGELASAARFGTRLIVVVFDDASLSLIRIKQSEGDPTEGVSFPSVDWTQVAAGFGMPSTEAQNKEELCAALEWAVRRDHPSLISVRVDPSPYKAMMKILRG